ncbi:unnamed protein product [marine sediment metagenome]|uniref:Uncharacterized protein n=1 Tax=marine sediment metagenome TaxID=412755 RepID=X0SSV4_9ZZZZ
MPKKKTTKKATKKTTEKKTLADFGSMTKVTEMTAELLWNRVEKTPNFVKFQVEDNDLIASWKKSDKCRYIPKKHPFSGAKTIQMTLEVIEMAGEDE